MGDTEAVKGYKCKIINIEPDPKHPGRQIVSVQVDDGDEQRGVYNLAFSLLPPETPMSVEKFALMLQEKDLSRPVDGFQYLKDAQNSGETFEIVIKPADTTQN